MSSKCHLVLLIAVEKAKASLIFCSLKMAYFFYLESCKILFFYPNPYSFKFLWSYLLVLLLLLILPGTLDILFVTFFKYNMFSLSIDFDSFVCFLFFTTFGNLFCLEIESPNLTASLALFSYYFLCLFNFAYCNYGSGDRGWTDFLI